MTLKLAGGLVVDGTGARPRIADVTIADGRIAEDQPADEVRDVTGRVVCPGFVDINTHSDLAVLSNPLAHSKVRQGVTTEIVGNDGIGLAPLPDLPDISALRAAARGIDLDPTVPVGWQDLGGYLDTVAAARPSHRIGALAAHLPLRAGILGFGDKKPDNIQLKQMCALLETAFAQGALGLSTGVARPPLGFATEEELVALAHVCAAHDAVLSWHLRDYGGALTYAVREALAVADRTGVRTQIAHLAPVGRRNWGTVAAALDLVDRATDRGLRVGIEVDPYPYGTVTLADLLPPWATDGGPDALRDRLADPQTRARIGAAWDRGALRWPDITVAALPGDGPGPGTPIADDDAALDLLTRYGAGVQVTTHARDENDLRTVLAHPATVVTSTAPCRGPDGATATGAPHPRSYGTFPRYLAAQNLAPHGDLAAAVARCTSAPAAVLGLDTGILRPGAPADIVVFDPARLADRATPTDPRRSPDGIDLVLVAGEPVVDGGTHTGARPGGVLRRTRSTG